MPFRQKADDEFNHAHAHQGNGGDSMLILKSTTNKKMQFLVEKKFEERPGKGDEPTIFVGQEGGPSFRTWVQDRERFGDNYAVKTAHSIYSFLIVS